MSATWAWVILMWVMAAGPYLARRALSLPAGLSARRTDNMRRKKLETLQREETLREFHAYQECPKCRKFDWHWIKRGYIGELYRECRNPKCGYTWRQHK